MKQLLLFVFFFVFFFPVFVQTCRVIQLQSPYVSRMCKLEELNYCGTSSKTLAKVENHYHRTFPRTFLENCFLALFDYCKVSVVFN